MENLRLGVSAVRHDMRREETVEEAEKNTELGRQTPKRKASGSNPLGRTRKKDILPDVLFCLFTGRPCSAGRPPPRSAGSAAVAALPA